MIFVCASERASVRVSFYMHCIHSIVFQSTGKYPNYFTFRAKFFIYFLAITIGEKFCVCLYISWSSLHASLKPFYSIHFPCLCFPLPLPLDADIINIRLVICFPKYFMQCCLYSSISERLVYSLFVCFVSFHFVSFCFVCSYRCVSIFFGKSSSVFLYFFNCHHHTTAESFEFHAHAFAFAS